MPVVRFNGKKLDPATIKALVSGTLVNGSKPSVWWNRQSIDFRNNFMDTMRTSMRNGESLTQATARVIGGTVDGVTVPGIMKTTKARANALAATAQSAVTNEAALKSYQANNDVIKMVTQVSTLDNRTSDICIAYSGQTWNVNTLRPVTELGSRLPFNGGPPRHFNCRSRLRPVTKSFRELGIDADEIPASTRASMDGQVPSDITFDQFLKSKPQSFADDLLGPKRAQLYRDGDITLTQLVDMRGNPMTLAQLEQKIGIKPKLVPKPPIPTQPKLVKSFLDDVFITETEHAEITAHAKRLVAAADDADVLVTKQVKKLAKDVNAKFPDAAIVEDGPLVDEGSLFWRKKDLDSTSRKIQTYARDRDLTFTEASNQISDSLRYTYVVDDDDYIRAIQEAMERFAELGYKNNKFDPAWLLRPDYKGLNVNFVSPQGVRMELQFHTAQSFEVKNGINHTLYEKFRKLSKVKQAGPEGQALQADMLANAQAIPVPKNIQFLEDLAKIYNKPNVAKQNKIFEQAKKRQLAAEKKFAEKKAAAAAKKAEKKAAAAARKAERKATRKAKELDGVITDPKKVKEAAHKFLREQGIDERHIKLADDLLDMMEGSSSISFGAAQRETLLDIIKPRIKLALEQEAKALRVAKSGAPTKAPEFKTLKEAKQWFDDNLTNPASQFTDVTGTAKFTGDKNAYRLTANVTLMMRDRFGMSLPNYAGMRSGHAFPFGRSSANAAVHMESDSLLMLARGMNAQQRIEGAWSQYIRYHGADGSSIKVGKKVWHAKYNGDRDQTRRAIQRMIDDEPPGTDLMRALKAALKDDDFVFTVGGMTRDADFMYWRTMVHENGHRMHAQNRVEIDGILKTIIDSGDYSRWIQATSRYAGANQKEFFAEQFTMYLSGNKDRVHPLLKEFFERLDRGGPFDQELFKIHNAKP
jgi:hypothetical protein